MKRREFLAASAAALAGTALVVAVQDDGPTPREPDLVLDRYGGAIAISPDSKVLAVARGPVGDVEGICFLDAESGKCLPDFEQTTEIGKEGEPSDVIAYSANGRYFAAGADGFMALWDARNGRRLADLGPIPDRPSGRVSALAFTHDSKYLFGLGGFWPLEPAGDVQELEGLAHCESVAFSIDGERCATRFKGVISLWDMQTRRKLMDFGRTRPTSGVLEFTPDGRLIASSMVPIDGRPYFLWDTETGKPKYVPFEHLPSFDLSPDGSLIIGVIPGGAALLRIEDGRAAYKLVKQSEIPKKGRKRAADHNGVVGIQFSPNQTMVAHSRRLGLKIWKEKTGFKG